MKSSASEPGLIVMSREGVFENMGSTCFSSLKILQELEVQLKSAEKVRFEVPKNFLTVSINLLF